jgi:hypothetical protein
MRPPCLSHATLMEESECRIETVAREGGSFQALAARRLVEGTRLYPLWKSAHSRLMRQVAVETRPLAQAAALRSVYFGLVHRKAMFEYLRAERITGRDRHAVFELIHGGQDYAQAVVAEHSNYIRSVSSLLCSRHIGRTLLADRAFGEPMLRYEQRYADFFRVFCNCVVKSNRFNSDDTLSTLVPYLKRQLGTLRRAIRALSLEPDVGGLYTLEIDTPAANAHRASSPFQAA